jgi:hypothetical protein
MFEAFKPQEKQGPQCASGGRKSWGIRTDPVIAKSDGNCRKFNHSGSTLHVHVPVVELSGKAETGSENLWIYGVVSILWSSQAKQRLGQRVSGFVVSSVVSSQIERDPERAFLAGTLLLSCSHPSIDFAYLSVLMIDRHDGRETGRGRRAHAPDPGAGIVSVSVDIGLFRSTLKICADNTRRLRFNCRAPCMSQNLKYCLKAERGASWRLHNNK